MTINLNVSSRKEAISVYLGLLFRFHKLTEKEMEVCVELILTYFQYLEVYKNKEAVNKLYLEKESRLKIRKELGDMTQQVLNNYLTIMKKKKVILADMSINPVLLPDINNISLTINLKYEQ